MSEVEKLYKNVGLDNLWVERYDSIAGELEIWHPSYKVMIKSMMKKNDWTLTEAQNVAKKECHKEYPPFTPEKQLELIEFYIKSVWWLNLACFKSSSLPFGEELAKLTNHLWEDMTISQQEQIRSILNG